MIVDKCDLGIRVDISTNELERLGILDLLGDTDVIESDLCSIFLVLSADRAEELANQILSVCQDIRENHTGENNV